MAMPLELSPGLRAWAGSFVGATDPDFAALPGGYGTGPRGRITGRGGMAFVKATPLHAPHVDDDRTEAMVLVDLPPRVGAPSLLGAREQDGWHVTVTEHVDGVHPREPWRLQDLTAVLEHIRAMHEALAGHPLPPVPSVAERMRGRATTWSRLASGAMPSMGAEALTPWEREHLDRLADAESTFPMLVAEPQLLHFDLRHDNILMSSSGSIRILDWGRASAGPAWVDVVCMLLESAVDAPSLEPVFAEATRRWSPEPVAVDSFLATLASYWRGVVASPADAPPELTRRRLRSLAATEEWLAERWR